MSYIQKTIRHLTDLISSIIYAFSDSKSNVELISMQIKRIENEITNIQYLINLNQPILIYQMGKVASNSILKSLAQFGFKNIFHVHRISNDEIKKIFNNLKKSNRFYPYCDEVGAFIRESQILKKSKVVTLVRETISRNISAFFQNIHIWFDTDDIKKISSEDAIKLFLKRYPHHQPQYWFENEFNKSTGINIFNQGFDKEKGYSILKKGSMDILVLKVETPDHVKEIALNSFFNVSGIKLTSSNKAREKEYSHIYQTFLEKIQLPNEFVKICYETPYMRHFYTKNEINNFYNKWSGDK